MFRNRGRSERNTSATGGIRTNHIDSFLERETNKKKKKKKKKEKEKEKKKKRKKNYEL